METPADVLGRPIEFVDVTPEQLVRESIRRGTPADFAEAMRNLNEPFRAGRAGVLSDDIENLTGTAAGTFRAWCERHIEAFR